MVRAVIGVSLVAVVSVLLPPLASAQQTSSIAGVVKDASGAVLPGVTVEAASPALIEKVRTVVTDGEGQYKIVDVRPGSYVVTFTLTGFSTFRREGIELTSGFTATVNADMKVGALEETVTVTGASPLVDTQNVRKQNIVSSELLEALPTSLKNEQNLTNLTLGMVGYAFLTGEYQTYVGNGFHGQLGGQGKRQFDGMGIDNRGGAVQYTVNVDAVEEMTLQTNGITAESNASGILVNTIPKEGSNTFKGSINSMYTNEHLQASNLTDELRARGLTATDKIRYIYAAGGGVGGPIKQDKLWFFTAHRISGFSNFVADVYWNKTQGTPFYTADLSRPVDRGERYSNDTGRMTWQATQRNKFSFFADVQVGLIARRANLSTAPEAGGAWRFWPQGLYQATWSAPLTNKLLMEGAGGVTVLDWPAIYQEGVSVNDISTRDVSTNFTYGATPTYNNPQDQKRYAERFSLSYITGSHAFKTGFNNEQMIPVDTRVITNQNQRWEFTGTTPSRIIQLATPYTDSTRLKSDLGIYAQDQWTIKRLTLNYGLRFEYFNAYVPAQDQPATPNGWVAARHFDAVNNVPNWKDWSPRMGAAYDLFGNSRTALKFSVGKYMSKNNAEIPTANNPINSSVNSVTRTWNDNFYGPGDPRSGNYVPDCNLANRAADGECGPMSDPNFGGLKITTRYADDAIHGFGARDYNWDMTTEVQHQFSSTASITAGYYRNWYNNFRVTDNLAVTASDFDPYCITAPIDARLPGGGGYQVCGLYDVSVAKFGKVDNLVTQAAHYGKQSRASNFFTAMLNTRFGSGMRLSGGVDFGRTVTDNCFTIDSPQQLVYCHQEIPFRGTVQVKLNGSYPLPGDFVVSGVLLNVAGPVILADYTALNSQIAPSLGRNLAQCGAAAVCTATAGPIPLIEPYTQFEGRRTQVDMRLTKMLKIGAKMRLQLNVDAYNFFNTAPLNSIITAYGANWLKPAGGTAIGAGVQLARQFQFSGQLNF